MRRDAAIVAAAREAVSYLREEADFNRSWTDGRRGADIPTSDGYTARRTEIARQRDRWADAIDLLVNTRRWEFCPWCGSNQTIHD